jgi:hypothetical protein
MGAEAPAAALGPFRVCVEKEREAAFRREIGCAAETNGEAPVSFPAVWLTLPEIRAALSQECAKMDAVPVHESQSFSCLAPLRVGESYDVTVAVRREAAPPRLILDAAIATPSGELCARVEALVRIVPRSGLRVGSSA